MDDELFCSICYNPESPGYDIHDTCDTCHIKLCMKCWYNHCNMYCPICDRGKMNKPHTCNLCLSEVSLQKIHICSICNYSICDYCQKSDCHGCTDIILNSENDCMELKDTIDIVVAYVKYEFKGRLKGNSFRKLGYINSNVGKIDVFKDTDSEHNQTIMFMWDFMGTELLFNRVSDKIQMTNINVCNLKTGIKIYLWSDDNTLKNITEFIEKMKSMKTCDSCKKDLTMCYKSTFCSKCYRKKQVLKKWKTKLNYLVP